MIGKLRDKVRLRRPVEHPRADGGMDIAVTDIETVWASVVPINGQETELSGRLNGETTFAVELYRRDDLRHGDHIVWGEVILHVSEIRMPRAREMTMRVTAVSGLLPAYEAPPSS